MKLVTFRRSGSAPEPGVAVDDRVIGLSGAGYRSLLDIIENWGTAKSVVETYVANAPQEAVSKAADITLLAPIPRPRKVICVGLNYRDHAAESKMEIPSVPTIFSKFATSVIGPGEQIVLPKNSAKPDYEAEFAFVIGRHGRHVPADRWQEHVFGYTIVNDVSARDFQMATSQWLMGKTFDTFAPIGPWIVTSDEIADPHQLDIKMTISGEVLQNSNTRELIFRIPELVGYLSSVFTLEPGDIVSTGTPAGVGFGHKPPRWLRAGDECAVYVEGIGELRNPVVAESKISPTVVASY
jgi:2-keto-4-pentenoate hydratase/2-oxohepta-3-ene-1,7-dioic acid hydratase in catechol pathway